MNTGNIYFLQNDMEEALSYYEKAETVRPENPKVLLALSRVHHELENYGLVKKHYNKLRIQDPKLAEMFSYLALRGEQPDRADVVSKSKKDILWEEEWRWTGSISSYSFSTQLFSHY